jgi:hypothetical protein
MRFSNAYADRPLVGLLVALVAIGSAAPTMAASFEDVTDTVAKGMGDREAVWGDFDNDGWVDVYNGDLWRNEGGKKFTRVDGPFGRAGIWGDYDLDGDLDLYLYNSGKLIQNNGSDGFKDVSDILAKRPIEVCRGAVWGDFNGDGFLDLYITGYEVWDEREEWHDVVFKNNKGESFTQVWQTPEIQRARGVTY